jgi:hypothetical protein
MTRDPAKHRRRSLRLQGYDYAQAGAYFVTICTQGRTCLFGEVTDGSMRLIDAGQMLAALWDDIPARFPDVELDAFVVMPNHLHGIILLPDTGATTNRATTRVAPTKHHDDANAMPLVGAPLVGARNNAPTLGDVVGAFKSAATVEYIRGVKAKGWPEFRRRLWQRNY